MSTRQFAHLLVLLMALTAFTNCSPARPAQVNVPTAPPTLPVESPVPPTDEPPIIMASYVGFVPDLDQLVVTDLIIQGTIADIRILQVPRTTMATQAELAERQARGEAITVEQAQYHITVDQVSSIRSCSTSAPCIPNSFPIGTPSNPAKPSW